VETGEHALAGLSKVDAELLAEWGGRVGWAGNLAQLAVALNEWSAGGMNRNEELGEAVGGVGGSVLGGMATGAAVGLLRGSLHRCRQR